MRCYVAFIEFEAEESFGKEWLARELQLALAHKYIFGRVQCAPNDIQELTRLYTERKSPQCSTIPCYKVVPNLT